MKEFIQVLKRFIPPYKKYLVLTVLFNILSALLNIFSFMAIIQTEGTMEPVTWIPWSEMTLGNISEVLSNNANSLVQEMVTSLGPTTTMLVIGLFLAFATFLKTGAYFLSSATIVPVRTGVVRDIRNQLYQKINSLPL